MADKKAVIEAAQRLYKQNDEEALEVLIGKRELAVKRDPTLKDNVDLEPRYDEDIMGPLDGVKAVGKSVLRRWNGELCDLVCGNNAGDSQDRKAVLDSLNIGEAALIGSVAGALLSLGVYAAIAAAVAPLIVKRFIWPAKDELCKAWKELIAMG
jgi:hypothetical protein